MLAQSCAIILLWHNFLRVYIVCVSEASTGPFPLQILFYLTLLKNWCQTATHYKSSHLIPKKKKKVVTSNEMIKSFIIGTREAVFRAWLHHSVQFSSVAQSCLTLCDPMNHSKPGLPVHHQLLEFTQTHVHWVSDAIQPSHLLSSPSPPAPNSPQHQSLFQWVNSLHEVVKVLEFQL